ncbi:MAG TPA: hypothetical protein VER55_07950, partial [Ardenticatenaceae bacterium]|nr:hypothetical protein [Ardenticatenaceae bacterium]
MEHVFEDVVQQVMKRAVIVDVVLATRGAVRAAEWAGAVLTNPWRNRRVRVVVGGAARHACQQSRLREKRKG